jgi:hypothetical protein
MTDPPFDFHQFLLKNRQLCCNHGTNACVHTGVLKNAFQGNPKQELGHFHSITICLKSYLDTSSEESQGHE